MTTTHAKREPEPERGLTESPTTRRAHPIHQRREMFGLAAWPTYKAIAEESVTLEEALHSANAVAWK